MKSLVVFAALLGFLLVLVVSASGQTTPVRPQLVGTIGWLPGSGYVHASGDGWTDDTGLVLPTRVAFGQSVDILSMRSSLDFRVFIMQTPKLANDELMSTSASAGQVDSLLNFAQVVPAAGEVFEGYMPWLVAPAPSDTLWISGYVWR